MIIPFVIVFMLPASPLFSLPLEVGATLARQKMGVHLNYYLDATGEVGIREISSREYRDTFIPLPRDDYGLGYTDATVWLRATVINRTGADCSWLLECEYPLVDDICLYTPKGREYAAACTGDRKPFVTRPIRSRTFLFPVVSPPGESTCYIRMVSEGAINVSFTAWSRAAREKHEEYESLYLWVCYGIMLAFIIYNFFIFVSSRDPSYLFLSLFTISMVFHSMSFNGLAFQYLWPNSPAWGNGANLFFNNFANIFAVSFARSFLDTRLTMPRWYDRLLQAVILLFSAYLILLLVCDYNQVVAVITISTGIDHILLIIPGVYLLFKRSRQAAFYMSAWLCLLIVSFLLVLRSLGLVHEGMITVWGGQIGTTVLVALLSLGVADKINIMRNEREHALAATREAEEKYRALIETTNTGYVILDEQGRVVDANAEYIRMTGHEALDKIINRRVIEWTDPSDGEKNRAAIEDIMRQGFIRNFEIDYIHNDGAILPVEINATVVETREGRRILSLCRDITYRRTVFQNLLASIREKDLLLKEVHHRVKNNLQIISSLLNLQANRITSPEIRTLYGDMNNRIRAMAIIHERMYQTSDFARIDLADYITTIAHDLGSAYAVNRAESEMRLDIEPVFMEISRAIPCGLMINEILSNIFKYAFPPGFAGRPMITIALHRVDDDGVELVIGDNGVGLPGDIVPEKSGSLGLSLIHLLTSQLRGTVEIDREGGTRYTIRFSAVQKKRE